MRFTILFMIMFSVNSFAMEASADMKKIRSSRPKNTSSVDIVFAFKNLSKVGHTLSRDKRGILINLSVAGSGEGSLSVNDSSDKKLQGAQRDFNSSSLSANIFFNQKQYEEMGEILKKCQDVSEAALFNGELLIIRGSANLPDSSLRKAFSVKMPSLNVTLNADYQIDCYSK